MLRVISNFMDFLLSLAISFGLSATLVSVLSHMATPVVVGARFLGTFVFTAILCRVQNVDVTEVPKEHFKILILRSIFGLMSFACGG